MPGEEVIGVRVRPVGGRAAEDINPVNGEWEDKVVNEAVVVDADADIAGLGVWVLRGAEHHEAQTELIVRDRIACNFTSR